MNFLFSPSYFVKYVIPRRICIFLFVLCSFPLVVAQDNAVPQLFEFSFNKAEKYRIEIFNTQSVYRNDRLVEYNIEIENRILVNLLKRGDDGIMLDYAIETIEEGHLINEDYSVFHQQKNGKMVIAKKFNMPFIRNIPMFPNEPVLPKEKWTFEGEEVFTSPDTGQRELLVMPVEYEYMGYDDVPQEIYDNITDQSVIRMRRAPYIKATYYIKDYALDTHKKKILNSKFDIEMWWNVEDGRLECYRENFDVSISTDGDVIRFAGSDVGVMIPVGLLNKKIETLKKDVESQLPNVKVDENEKGISITIEQIQFDPNSSNLTYEEIAKLEVIARILDTYKGRRILVEGHTAMAGTEQQREALSTERAQEVVNVLKRFVTTKNLQFLFKGHGAKKPIATNYTEEGRARNRRVEITILEN